MEEQKTLRDLMLDKLEAGEEAYLVFRAFKGKANNTPLTDEQEQSNRLQPRSL